MNIDIEAFKKWYEARYSPGHGLNGFLARDEWYVNPQDLLEFMVNQLEEFNTGTLAESA